MAGLILVDSEVLLDVLIAGACLAHGASLLTGGCASPRWSEAGLRAAAADGRRIPPR